MNLTLTQNWEQMVSLLITTTSLMMKVRIL